MMCNIILIIGFGCNSCELEPGYMERAFKENRRKILMFGIKQLTAEPLCRVFIYCSSAVRPQFFLLLLVKF